MRTAPLVVVVVVAKTGASRHRHPALTTTTTRTAMMRRSRLTRTYGVPCMQGDRACFRAFSEANRAEGGRAEERPDRNSSSFR